MNHVILKEGHTGLHIPPRPEGILYDYEGPVFCPPERAIAIVCLDYDTRGDLEVAVCQLLAAVSDHKAPSQALKDYDLLVVSEDPVSKSYAQGLPARSRYISPYLPPHVVFGVKSPFGVYAVSSRGLCALAIYLSEVEFVGVPIVTRF